MVSNNIHILLHAFALSTPSAEPRHRQSIAARRVKVPSPDVLPGNKERKPATKLKKKIHYTSPQSMLVYRLLHQMKRLLLQSQPVAINHFTTSIYFTTLLNFQPVFSKPGRCHGLRVLRGCLVLNKFQQLSHRMFGHMYEVLNID